MPEPNEAEPNDESVLSRLVGGDEEIKMLDITRQFDFGQFIELFDIREIDGKKIPAPVVIDTLGDPGRMASQDQGGTTPRLRPATATTLRPMTDLLHAIGDSVTADTFEIDEAVRYEPSGVSIEVDGRTYGVPLDEGQLARLDAGAIVSARGTHEENGATTTLDLHLVRTATEVTIGFGKLGDLLAGAVVGDATYEMTPPEREALVRGGKAMAMRVKSDRRDPVSLSIPPDAELLQDSSFKVLDIPAFLSDPMLPGTNGRMVKVEMKSEQMQAMLERRPVSLTAGERTVLLEPSEGKYLDSAETGDAGEYSVTPVVPASPVNVGMPGARVVKIVAMSGMPNPLPDAVGLSVAVYVPWRQNWKLRGFSRGNLLSTIALAPSEEVTMELRTWERQASSLEQSTETESETQAETVQTTRDTEDVFKEMLSKSDFTLQASASVDASFDWGVATMNLSGDVAAINTDSLQNTCRNSRENLRESTTKASSRVRSRRVTRITQSKESGREEKVTRTIRNPNPARTLTFDFFETLAHYDITLSFMKERLRLVVLVPNPIRIQDFTEADVRVNEQALRNGLLDPTLADGFVACRQKAAYAKARDRLNEEAHAAAKIKSNSIPPVVAGTTSAPSPWAAQEDAIKGVVGKIANARRALDDNGIDSAFDGIATMPRTRSPNFIADPIREKAQRWLFMALCRRQFPNVMAQLDALKAKSAMTVDDARSLLAVLPGLESPTRLSTLAQFPENQKEELALSSKMKEWSPAAGERRWMNDDQWFIFTARMRVNGLYTPMDCGITGLCESLPQLFRELEQKMAAAAAVTDVVVAKAVAEGEQDKATVEDRLQMAFPLDDYAYASERAEALIWHLNQHRSHYNYALFQALPPALQLTRINEASQGNLPIGLFEPRVIGLAGERLVVPLTPLAGTSSKLRSFIQKLANDLEDAFTEPAEQPQGAGQPAGVGASGEGRRTDTVVLPTPGISIMTRLGRFDAAEPNVMDAMKAQSRHETALARQEEAEADRREALVKSGDLQPFERPSLSLAVAPLGAPLGTPAEPPP